MNLYNLTPKSKLCHKVYLKTYDATPERKRYQKAKNLKQYNLTLEQKEEMLTKQNNCCAVCGRNQSEFKRELGVDHNHKTGKVRGLLCHNCNIHLAGFDNIREYFAKQNISILKTIIEYLNRE